MGKEQEGKVVRHQNSLSGETYRRTGRRSYVRSRVRMVQIDKGPAQGGGGVNDKVSHPGP